MKSATRVLSALVALFAIAGSTHAQTTKTASDFQGQWVGVFCGGSGASMFTIAYEVTFRPNGQTPFVFVDSRDGSERDYTASMATVEDNALNLVVPNPSDATATTRLSFHFGSPTTLTGNLYLTKGAETNGPIQTIAMRPGNLTFQNFVRKYGKTCEPR